MTRSDYGTGARGTRWIAALAFFVLVIAPLSSLAATATYTPPQPVPDDPCGTTFGSTVTFTGGASVDKVTVLSIASHVVLSLPTPGPCVATTFSDDSGRTILSDSSAKITPGPGCSSLTTNQVVCPWAEVLQINLGSGDDYLFLSASLQGYVDQGVPFVGLQGASIVAGPGNDMLRTVNGAKDKVSCGIGNDTVVADRFDVVGSGCEHVTRV